MEKCESVQKRRRLTPLHVAASQGNEEMVLTLLQNGYNPNSTDRLGNTPLHYCGHKEIAACLVEWGADTMTRYGICITAVQTFTKISLCANNLKTQCKSFYQVNEVICIL